MLSVDFCAPVTYAVGIIEIVDTMRLRDHLEAESLIYRSRSLNVDE